jgi:hypothetical protein
VDFGLSFPTASNGSSKPADIAATNLRLGMGLFPGGILRRCT